LRYLSALACFPAERLLQINIASYCVSFMMLKHASAQAREFAMEGSIVSATLIFRFSSM
jgi:hypothetical protein